MNKIAFQIPLFALVTPAHVHDSQVGWFVILVTAVLFGLKVLVVYAGGAYFDHKTSWAFTRPASTTYAKLIIELTTQLLYPESNKERKERRHGYARKR